MYCEVYLFDAPYHIDRPFDYLCDQELKVGSIVKVPFGKFNNLRFGVVVKVKENSDGDGIKSVHSVVDSRFWLDEELLGLCLFLKSHTLCSFGEAARCMLPQGALSETPNIKLKKTCVLNLTADQVDELLSAKGRAGIRSEGQRLIIQYLKEIGTADIELVRAIPGASSANILALRDKGIIKKPPVHRRFFSLSKNLFFDRLAEVKEAPKTSNSTPKCMWILERGELRSKAKCLA